MNDNGVIDLTGFNNLLASVGNDKAFLRELIDTYLADAPKLIATMHSSLDAGNVEEFRRAAHSLKSNSASLGASTLAMLAKDLELLAKTGTLNGAAEKIPAMESEYARVNDALQELVR